jgi:hypothetical protein
MRDRAPAKEKITRVVVMRTPTPAARITRMPPTTIRVVIELDPAAEPISGMLTQDDGQTMAFHGWLALTEALEASRHAAPGLPDAAPRAR